MRKPAIRDWNDSDLLALEASEVDNTGTVATEDRFENFRKSQREKEDRRQAAAAQGLSETILEGVIGFFFTVCLRFL